MRQQGKSTGLTIVELLAVILVVLAMLVMALPTIGGAKGNAGVQQSMSNLVGLGVAHVLYAADWGGRQVTWVRDDLGAYGGNIAAYNNAVGGCQNYPYPVGCQPGVLAGWNCEGVGPWGYWPYSLSAFIQPMNFPGAPIGCATCGSWGTFRVPNAQPLHEYLNGRYHDPVYYAPNDTAVLALVEGCLEAPCEFNVSHPNIDDCNPGWSSYAMSPAAMFHHDVFRSNAAGGWRAPWQLVQSYHGPGLFQATYPQLKTLMIEHSWVQGPPAECNPANPGFGCEPYYFNQGIDSDPVTLFYDISVRLLPNAEVFAADQQVLQQTGGVDGLWHRGTPFGPEGYFIPEGYDGTPLSHHILTTDGILGRDTVGGAAPLSKPPRLVAAGPPHAPVPPKSIASRTDRQYIRFTTPVAADP